MLNKESGLTVQANRLVFSPDDISLASPDLSCRVVRVHLRDTADAKLMALVGVAHWLEMGRVLPLEAIGPPWRLVQERQPRRRSRSSVTIPMLFEFPPSPKSRRAQGCTVRYAVQGCRRRNIPHATMMEPARSSVVGARSALTFCALLASKCPYPELGSPCGAPCFGFAPNSLLQLPRQAPPVRRFPRGHSPERTSNSAGRRNVRAATTSPSARRSLNASNVTRKSRGGWRSAGGYMPPFSRGKPQGKTVFAATPNIMVKTSI